MNDLTPPTIPAQAHDDAWVPTSCAFCYGSCSILAHRVDGVVVKVEGNPQSIVRYLTERRQLGFQLSSVAYSLRSLADHVRHSPSRAVDSGSHGLSGRAS